MEAGYDWLLVRSQVRRRMFRIMGFTLVGVGALFISGSVAYYAYAARANAGLKGLEYTAPAAAAGVGAVVIPESTLADRFAGAIGAGAASGAVASATESGTADSATSGAVVAATFDATVATLPEAAVAPSAVQPAPQAIVALPSWKIVEAGLYPGETLHARFWNNTIAYEPPSVQQQALIAGFTPIDPSMVAVPGTLAATTRIQIPVIGVDSAVKDLEVVDLGDSRAYETPKRVVGRIPSTANAGEAGKVWLFGHLNSPINGEGAVFSALPEIPDLLRQGQDVYVVLTNADGAEYLYRLNASTVLPPEKMTVADGGGPDLALVTCVPNWVYDKRLVITGTLVGEKQP